MSFKNQTFKLREEAILNATTAALVEYGFELMTMDDIATRVGISKPSLYKHFASREDLVAATMTRLIQQAIDQLDSYPDAMPAFEKLKNLLGWAIDVRLHGGMPFLPSTRPSIRDLLLRNQAYVMNILNMNQRLNTLVTECQQEGSLNPELPVQVILYSYYARTCDPTVDYLVAYSELNHAAIRDHMITVSFAGLIPPNRSQPA